MDIGVVGAILGVVLLLGAAWPVFRSKNTSATIELLRSELEVEKEAREAQGLRCQEELAEQDKRHAVAIAELRGKVEAMTPVFASQIAAAVDIEKIAQRVVASLNGQS